MEVELKDQIFQIEKLSISFPIAEQVMWLVDRPHVSVSDLLHWISADPVLTARILKLANFMNHGCSGKISTLNHAVVLIGFQGLKDLLMGILVVDQLSWNVHPEQPDAHDWYRHSRVVAAGARYLARELGYPIPGEAFVAGLLHDIGVQILVQQFPAEYEKIKSLVQERSISSLEAEQDILQTDHARLGGWLLETWKLPEKLVHAVAFHHDNRNFKEANLLTSIVRLADNICSSVTAEEKFSGQDTGWSEKELLEQIGLYFPEYEGSARTIQRKFRDEWEYLFEKSELPLLYNFPA